jgi:hypothetical protein
LESTQKIHKIHIDHQRLFAQDLAMIGDTVPSAQEENKKNAAAPPQSIENHRATLGDDNSFSTLAGNCSATLDKSDEINTAETSTHYGKFDVLLGRGRSAEKYPGNRRFQGTGVRTTPLSPMERSTSHYVLLPFGTISSNP